MEIDIKGIMERIPHRYPMLLVDRVLEMQPGKSIKALKNVSIGEPFFEGHFPHLPVMPGVLIIEALAQAAAIFTFSTEEGSTLDPMKTGYYLVGIDETRFRKPVVPGDQLILNAEAVRVSKSMSKYKVWAEVDGQVVASAVLMCAVRDL